LAFFVVVLDTGRHSISFLGVYQRVLTCQHGNKNGNLKNGEFLSGDNSSCLVASASTDNHRTDTKGKKRKRQMAPCHSSAEEEVAVGGSVRRPSRTSSQLNITHHQISPLLH
jgi:hypothetical protein